MAPGSRVEDLRLSARQTLALGLPDLSAALSTRALALEGDDPETLDLQAIACFEIGHNAEVLSATAAAIELSGTTPLRDALRAEAMRRSGDPLEAIALSSDALARFPGDMRLELTLAVALLDRGEPADALGVVDRAIEHGRATVELLDVGARAAEARDDGMRRLEMTRRSFDLSGRSPEAAVELSEALRAADERVESRAVLIDTLSRHPEDVRLQRALIVSTAPPRWLRILLVVFPFALAVCVAWLSAEVLGHGAPEAGAPQPGVLAFIAGCILAPAAVRAWISHEAGPHAAAVFEARRRFRATARIPFARWKYHLLGTSIAIIWATILGVLWGEALHVAWWVIWAAVFVALTALFSGGIWVAEWLQRRRSRPSAFIAELTGGCGCENVFFLQYEAAAQYRRIHLTGEIEPIAPDVGRLKCPNGNGTWLELDVPVEGRTPPILWHVLESTEPERVGLYL